MARPSRPPLFGPRGSPARPRPLARVFACRGVARAVPEAVDCSECGTRYDSLEHPFCPRCGSTARGAPVPGALASASRRAPGRRRVQAAGGVLLAIGLLFLASAGASLLLPAEEAAEPLADAFAGQPGGDVTVVFPSGAPANVTLTSTDGEPLANGTATDGRFAAEGLGSAAVRLHAEQGGAAWNGTLLVAAGDGLTVELPEGGGEVGLRMSPDLRLATDLARYALLGVALLLAAGGGCALALRLFPLAAAGAVAGAFLGVVALVGFLAVGLLFALPFGLCAYFILAGKRHFRGRASSPPPQAPPAQGPPR